MELFWTNTAENSIGAIFDHILKENPEAALHVCEKIEASVLQLEKFPQSGRIGRVPNTRELVMRNLPFIVIYQLNFKRIEILNIWHTSRDWPKSFHVAPPD